MYVAIGSIIVNGGTDYLFAIVFGMKTAGLALSTSTVALCNFFLLLALMRRKIGRLEVTALLRSLLRVAAASAMMTAAAYAAHRYCEFNRYIDMLVSMAVAFIVFGASCKLLRVDELGELLGVLKFGSKEVDR
jgi:peptidoglycan biosynthesis protein MviN/MurJ (putative lipid II flippase)